MKENNLSSKKVAKLIARFAADKKAENIVVLDMRKAVNFCDYFVICSSSSQRRISAIADSIDEGLDNVDISVGNMHGKKESEWVLIDTGDVVAHIFTENVREFYGLEHLWQDAQRIDWEK